MNEKRKWYSVDRKQNDIRNSETVDRVKLVTSYEWYCKEMKIFAAGEHI